MTTDPETQTSAVVVPTDNVSIEYTEPNERDVNKGDVPSQDVESIDDGYAIFDDNTKIPQSTKSASQLVNPKPQPTYDPNDPTKKTPNDPTKKTPNDPTKKTPKVPQPKKKLNPRITAVNNQFFETTVTETDDNGDTEQGDGDTEQNDGDIEQNNGDAEQDNVNA
ncbi:hypothetical protein FBU30_011332 [Linnemannia zychae]|nr:hypothetical protein FBU30_011332 [Linnemannia zychae]